MIRKGQEIVRRTWLALFRALRGWIKPILATCLFIGFFYTLGYLNVHNMSEGQAKPEVTNEDVTGRVVWAGLDGQVRRENLRNNTQITYTAQGHTSADDVSREDSGPSVIQERSDADELERINVVISHDGSESTEENEEEEENDAEEEEEVEADQEDPETAPQKLAAVFRHHELTDTYTNLLDVKPPKYLSNYKNPCWYEEIPSASPYINSLYWERRKEYLTEMETRRIKNLAMGKKVRLRCLPYFYIGGFTKCGTSELDNKIPAHPEVIGEPFKEPHWWTRWRVSAASTSNGKYSPIKAYIDLFDGPADAVEEHTVKRDGHDYHPLIFGEGTPNTVWLMDKWDLLPENGKHKDGPNYITAHYIRHIQPMAHFVVSLRNPVTRLYSDYLYFNVKNETPENFHEKCEKAIELMSACMATHSIQSCVYNQTLSKAMQVRIRISMYYPYLEDWLKVFPREQIHILRLEDYAANKIGTLNKIYKFLGLSTLPKESEHLVLDSKASNVRRGADQQVGPMLNKTRKLLTNFFRPMNQKLTALLHDDRFLFEES